MFTKEGVRSLLKSYEIKRIVWKTAHTIPIVIAIILLMGCSTYAGQGTATEDTAYLTPISQETLQAYQVGPPIRNKIEAVIAARRSLDTTIYMFYTEQPTVVLAEEMRLADAFQRVAQPQINNTYEESSGDMKVWLVIFEGEWQVIVPPAPEQPVVAPGPPSHRCVYVIINQNDSSNYEAGAVECSP